MSCGVTSPQKRFCSALGMNRRTKSGWGESLKAIKRTRGGPPIFQTNHFITTPLADTGGWAAKWRINTCNCEKRWGQAFHATGSPLVQTVNRPSDRFASIQACRKDGAVEGLSLGAYRQGIATVSVGHKGHRVPGGQQRERGSLSGHGVGCGCFKLRTNS